MAFLLLKKISVVTIRDLHYFLLSLLRPGSVHIFRSHITIEIGIVLGTRSQPKTDTGGKFRKFSTTTTSLERYGSIEVVRIHPSLIPYFGIFNQNNISRDSRISNHPYLAVFSS